MKVVDAIILAGGEGRRLRSVVVGVPKPLAAVDGRPFLDILLGQLDKSGCIGRVVLAVGYKAERIIDTYSGCSAFGFDIEFCVEEKLLGTGGAIKKAIGYTNSEQVLVMNGDSYTQLDIAGLIGTHSRNRAKLTIVLIETADTSRYGNVHIDAQNRITSFEEKRQTNTRGLISAGIYIFRREIFDCVEPDRIISVEEELFPAFLAEYKGNVRGCVADGKFIDIGIPDTYKIANTYLAGIEG